MNNLFEIISPLLTFAIAIAAWLISFLQLKRNRRQYNENIIFQNKLGCYQRIIKQSYDFLATVDSILEELPDFKGTKEEWVNEKMPSIFREYYPEVLKMESSIKEYSFLLPESFIKEFDEFILRCTRLLVEHYHFDNGYSIDKYNKLTEIHTKLINISRQDLHIDVLNTKLNYRLRN